MTDFTHEPDRRSWVASANEPGAERPIQNLPFATFQRPGAESRVGVGLGDAIVDLRELAEAGLLDGSLSDVGDACRAGDLSALLELDRERITELRRQLSLLLTDAEASRPRGAALVERLVAPLDAVELRLPARVGDYTDFYASIEHATNVGRLFRPDAPLLPNYRWVPIGYHGRASSIRPSGTPVMRPSGQRRPPDAPAPVFGPSVSLDYEAEVGMWVRGANALGTPVPLADAESRIFGLSLVNDWSARDIQAWEYQPLGPFLGKSFLTSVSPWVVTLDALAPYRTAARACAADAPLLPYLDHPDDRARGAFDVTVEVWLSTVAMRAASLPPVRISRGGLSNLYWTFAQMVTHHTSNGCNLRPGDLLASGTISGGWPDGVGCLLERTRRGESPLTLPTGETRVFLHDGDEIVLRGWAGGDEGPRIGFGDCRGVVQG